jgi:hypothetical protein
MSFPEMRQDGVGENLRLQCNPSNEGITHWVVSPLDDRDLCYLWAPPWQAL